MLFCLSCFLACSVGLAVGDTLRSPAPLRYGVKPELWNGLSGRRKMAAQKDEFLAVSRQTKELDRFSRISSFSFLSEHLASFSESQLDAFLMIGTSRPMRTSVVFVFLSEHLSSGNLFILFIVWLI